MAHMFQSVYRLKKNAIPYSFIAPPTFNNKIYLHRINYKITIISLQL